MRTCLRRWVGASAVAVVAAGAGLGAWGLWLEPSSLRVRSHELWLEHWPAECDGLRVAVLADLHVGAPFLGVERLVEIVEAVRGAQPRLILLAGDYVVQGVVGGAHVPAEPIARGLGPLGAIAPVYAVLGNHDWWDDGARMTAALTSVAIAVLEDASARVDLGDCTFWLAGISDVFTRPHDVDRALEAVPPGRPTIALTHNPDVFVRVPVGVALTVAGHTHGGQVSIPWFGPPIVPSRYGRRYARGEVREQHRTLFVSSGIGTSILPVRLLVPPEISLLELRSCVVGPSAPPYCGEKSTRR